MMGISMTIDQGDIWLVKFYPKTGSEISKIRPAIVVSHNSIGKLPLKTVVPITEWKDSYKEYPWMIKVEKTNQNNLSKISAVDCFQIKSFSDERFEKKIGQVNENLLKEIHQTILKTLNPIYNIKE